MKTRPYRRASSGFTLVELLVVVSIIIVLAAMSFGVVGLVTKKQKALTTQNDISAVVGALEAFQNEYSRMPNVGSTDQLTLDGESGSKLLTILLGKEDTSGEMQNPRQLVFLTAKVSTNKKKGGLIYRGGNQVEGMYDAWGNALNVKFDDDFDGEIQDPIKQGEVVRQKKVILWSYGPDGKVGDGDEVKSW